MSTRERPRRRARLLDDLASHLSDQLEEAAELLRAKDEEIAHLRLMFEHARELENVCRRLCAGLGHQMPLAVEWDVERPQAYPGPYTFWQAQEIAMRLNECDGGGWGVAACRFGGWQPERSEREDFSSE